MIAFTITPMVLCLVVALLQFKTVALLGREYIDRLDDYRQYPVPAFFEDLKKSKLKYFKGATLLALYVSLAAFLLYYTLTH